MEEVEEGKEIEEVEDKNTNALACATFRILYRLYLLTFLNFVTPQSRSTTRAGW